MKKENLSKLIKEHSGTEEPVHVEPEDANQILIKDIPQNTYIQISKVTEEGYYSIELEGEIAWENKRICIFMSHSWYRKFWDLPLGMPYHMDLMKRLVEFRKKEFRDINDIEFNDDGAWCQLSYTIFPKDVATLYDVYEYGIRITNWIDNIVNHAQDDVASLVLKISQEYSKYKLLEIPELIKSVSTEKDSNEKGRLLEELICKLFLKIDGFKISERVKTETEEIDIVVLNKSKNIFWQKESPLVLVECKNWSSKCGKNELVVFKQKIVNRRGRAKIGFFISWNGFAETFTREDLRTSQNDILIIPVIDKEIIQAFNHGDVQRSIEEWWLKAVNS